MNNNNLNKMIEILELRGCSKDTIKNRIYIIKHFSKFYNQPLESLVEKIITYLFQERVDCL